MGGNEYRFRYNRDKETGETPNGNSEFNKVEGEALDIANENGDVRFNLQKWLSKVDRPSKKLFENCPEFHIT